MPSLRTGRHGLRTWRAIGVMAALAALGILAAWIRLIPLELLSANDRAWQEVRNDLQTEVMRRLSAKSATTPNGPVLTSILDRWMHDNQRRVETETAAMAQGIREDLSYRTPDGHSYPYLSGFDSYLWLRYVRTHLRTGSPCDAIVNDACRDNYTDAPVGATSQYARRLHVYAIAELHRLISRFRPEYPLPETAFLMSVILGALAVVPAFFLGRLLGGVAGALFAGVFIAAHPAVLARTMSGDNDIWNLVLPLYATWAAVVALGSDRVARSAIYTALASVAIGLQAWAWSGWVFIYAVISLGCVGALLLEAGRFVLSEKSGRIWESEGVRRCALIVLTLYTGSAIGATLAGSASEYYSVPAAVFAAVRRAIGGEHAQSSSPDLAWPNALSTVAELAHMRLPEISNALGGGAVLLAGLIGLIVIALPGEGWTRRRGAACILAIWTAAGLYLASQGVRFMLLLAPPLGLVAAAAIGSGPPWYRRTTCAVIVVVLAVIVLQPLSPGYAVAREYAPDMNDAWWGALTRLRDRAAPEAIVHTLWDYGDWVTYVAERRVDNDGTSLLTHIPVWVGKALAAPREQDSVGVLRMLGCGSDVTPSEGAAKGAYGKLLALRHSPLEAYTILRDIVGLDETGAEAYLTARGVRPADRANILHSTHCAAPESYLILSSKMVEKRRSWMRFGLWDPAVPQTGEAAAVPYLARWLPCKTDPAARTRCEIQAEIPGRPERFVQFVASYAETPQLISRQRLTHIDGPPGIFIQAGESAIHEARFAESPYPDLGVLLDTSNSRILIGTASFLESTFVQLMYLDGRYTSHYEKVDDRAANGERVVTWKIN
jgi:hypothetical protein